MSDYESDEYLPSEPTNTHTYTTNRKMMAGLGAMQIVGIDG
jgi:hypothetical protein